MALTVDEYANLAEQAEPIEPATLRTPAAAATPFAGRSCLAAII